MVRRTDGIRSSSVVPQLPASAAAHSRGSDGSLAHSAHNSGATATNPQKRNTSLLPQGERSVKREIPWLSGFPLRRMVVGGGLVLLGLCFFFVVHWYHRAWVEVTVAAKEVTVEVPAQVVTTGEHRNVAEQPDGALTLMRLTHIVEGQRVVPHMGTRQEQQAARGLVEVRNWWRAQPIALVRGTRFQAPNGVVFRTTRRVVVPGKHNDLPGTTTVPVIAGVVGEEGNIPRGTPLLLPAFRGLPQYERIAGVAAVAFHGGRDGPVPVVATTTYQQAISRLTEQLLTQARRRLEALAHQRQLALADAPLQIVASSTRLALAGAQGATVSLRLEVAALAYDPLELTRALAQQDGANTVRTARVMLGDRPRTASTTVRVHAITVPPIATSSILAALAGAHRSDIAARVRTLPSVVRLKVRIFPFWRTMLPQDPSRITVRTRITSPPGTLTTRQ